MATAIDRSELHGAEIVDQVLLIPVEQIEAGKRLRAVDPVWAEVVGRMMQRDGQKKSIDVCRMPGATRWTLVDGAHRLAGARQLGIAYLRAEVVTANGDERRLREIMAQLGHRGLNDPIDRMAFVAELVQLKRAQAGLEKTSFRDASVKKAVRAEADLTLETISNVYGWSDEVGAELGLTGRTIRNDLAIYRGIAPSLIEKLGVAGHPLRRNATQLRALAKLEEGKQRRVVLRLLEDDLTFAAAMATVTLKVPADPETKRLSAFIGSFSRMTLSEKKGALAQLSGMLPAGTSLGAPPAPAFPADHVRYRDEALETIDAAIELIDGLEEDEIVKDERAGLLGKVAGGLRMTRLTVAGNGFKLGAKS